MFETIEIGMYQSLNRTLNKLKLPGTYLYVFLVV